MSATYNKIYAVVRQIPKGKVATYGQVAKLANLPGQARLVGYALFRVDGKSSNIPWHRVINARGEISLPKFSSSYREQKRRLRAEGVVFEAGRISLRRYAWHAGDASPLID